MQFLRHWSIRAESVLLLLLHWPWSWPKSYLEHWGQEDGDACKDEHHQTRQPLLPVGRRKKCADRASREERRESLRRSPGKGPCCCQNWKERQGTPAWGAGPLICQVHCSVLFGFFKNALLHFTYLYCVCACITLVGACLVSMWWSEDNSQDSVLSFTTQVPGSHGVWPEVPLPTEPPQQPVVSFVCLF